MDAASRSTISRRDLLSAGLLAGLAAGALGSHSAGAAAEAPTADPDAASTAREVASTGREPLILKPIPSTGERLPVIGLGTDAFRDSERGAIRAEIAKMYQLGGRVIDTAASYGDSETLIG
ncbi:MAG: hypothetical protein ACREUG_15720, partial [Steroidobacteraceae bacterium]